MTEAVVSYAARESDRFDKRVIAATVIGNALEVFDLLIFAQFAVYIGRAFFPMYSTFGQVLLTVSVYGAGLIVRPVGAIVIGAYADRVGRKSALTLTIALMAAATAIVGLTPSYEAIGLAAPILVLLARLVAGFSAGGELGTATTYLLEKAPRERRGLYASWQFASQGLGIFAGGLVGLILVGTLGQDEIQAWGWRIPFLLGTSIAPIGFYIRRQLEDTIDARAKHETSKEVFGQLWREHRWDVFWGSLAWIGPTISSYIISTYMTTYAITVLKLPGPIAMSAGLVAGATTVVSALVGGRLADRMGRRVMTIGPEILLLVLVYPAFSLVTETRSGAVFLITIFVLTFVRLMVSATLASQTPELFPRSVRTTGFSLCYSIATTIFGGTSQAVVTALIGVTGSPLAPAWYLVAMSLLTLLALVKLGARKPSSKLD